MLQNDNFDKDFVMRRRVFKNKKGYTLVELIVVMGIIGLLLTLTFSGYTSTRKEKYIQHVANLTQTNIRDTFIDILSTKVEGTGTCNGHSPQIKAVRIQFGNGSSKPVSKVARCQGATSNVLDNVETVEADIDPSQGINYSQKVEVKCDKCGAGSTLATYGYLYLVFTSPYGKYYSWYTNDVVSTTANNNFKGLGWVQNSNLSWALPSASNLDHDLVISFDSDTSATNGIIHTITISKNGSVKLD